MIKKFSQAAHLVGKAGIFTACTSTWSHLRLGNILLATCVMNMKESSIGVWSHFALKKPSQILKVVAFFVGCSFGCRSESSLSVSTYMSFTKCAHISSWLCSGSTAMLKFDIFVKLSYIRQFYSTFNDFFLFFFSSQYLNRLVICIRIYAVVLLACVMRCDPPKGLTY